MAKPRKKGGPKQKLRKKARIKKHNRDVKYAKLRTKLRADSQKKRRARKKKGFSLKGLDFDHKTGRFTTIKSNRGNRGKGTKKEGRKYA
tara:strand:- start:643 stop:909 length:267 start_codon:yes stop_codon:yes gene_type:complete